MTVRNGDVGSSLWDGGDIDAMALYAGTSIASVRCAAGAADIAQAIVRDFGSSD